MSTAASPVPCVQGGRGAGAREGRDIFVVFLLLVSGIEFRVWIWILILGQLVPTQARVVGIIGGGGLGGEDSSSVSYVKGASTRECKPPTACLIYVYLLLNLIVHHNTMSLSRVPFARTVYIPTAHKTKLTLQRLSISDT